MLERASPKPPIGDAFPEVLSACLAGDEDAFAQLWRAFQPSLLRYLRVVAGARQADDLASETWLEVARSLSRFEGDETGFRGWLFTIARRRRLDWIRRESRRPSDSTFAMPDTPDDVDVPTIVVDELSTNEALALIATLPPDQAEAVTLRIIGDLTVAQVAQIMDREQGAVRVLTHRGLRRLAERLTTQPRERV